MIPTFEALRDQGKIGVLGLTAIGDTSEVLKAIDSGAFASAQVSYNMLNPSAATTLPDNYPAQDYGRMFEHTKAKGVGVIGIRTLAGGALSGSAAREPNASPPPEPIGSANSFDSDLARARRFLPMIEEGFAASLAELATRFVDLDAGDGHRADGHRDAGSARAGHRRGRERSPALGGADAHRGDPGVVRRRGALVGEVQHMAEAVASERVALDPNARRIALIVASAFFIQHIDGAIINTSLPQMAASFAVQPVDINIGITAYLLSMAAFVPLGGWIADRFGAKHVFASAIVIFVVASIACGLSQTLWQFAAARIVQGAGAALMAPVGRIVVLRNTEKSSLIDAIALTVWPALIAPVIGPLIGGLITTYRRLAGELPDQHPARRHRARPRAAVHPEPQGKRAHAVRRPGLSALGGCADAAALWSRAAVARRPGPAAGHKPDRCGCCAGRAQRHSFSTAQNAAARPDDVQDADVSRRDARRRQHLSACHQRHAVPAAA